jgi:hypothetical protein|tara:strand:+ start:1110 stop:2609 length:1500 start_codon:yes stop_codon:yes gene_type:complete
MSNYKLLKENKYFDDTNIVDNGTEGTKVATGTTAQRGSTTGQWRFNSTTGYFEGINATGGISSLEPDPTITSVDDGEVDSAGGGNQTIVVTGTNFTSGGTIAFVGTSAEFNASTTTFDNATQVTAVAPKSSFLNAQEPYKVKFTSATGKSGISATGLINVDNAPVWQTSAGSLGSIIETATGTHFTVSATDPEGDTVAYSLQSGSLGGLSLNSSTGAISGDPDDVSGSATLSFTLRATAGGKTADRAFTITVTDPPNDGSTSALAGRSCKTIFDLGSAYQGSSANGLYYITNYGTITAEQHYCLMDTNYSSGGWTLLYSGSSARNDWGGSNYQFNLSNSTTPNGGTNLYARNRSGTFTPTTSDKFMIRRHDNNDFKVHTIGTWQAGSNWQAFSGHYYLADGGSTVDANGNTMSRSGCAFNHFDCCAGSGGCSANGGDLCGFSTGNSNGCYGHNSGCDECFGGGWANANNPSNVTLQWGRNSDLEGTFVSYWFRRDSNNE